MRRVTWVPQTTSLAGRFQPTRQATGNRLSTSHIEGQREGAPRLTPSRSPVLTITTASAFCTASIRNLVTSDNTKREADTTRARNTCIKASRFRHGAGDFANSGGHWNRGQSRGPTGRCNAARATASRERWDLHLLVLLGFTDRLDAMIATKMAHRPTLRDRDRSPQHLHCLPPFVGPPIRLYAGPKTVHPVTLTCVNWKRRFPAPIRKYSSFCTRRSQYVSPQYSHS